MSNVTDIVDAIISSRGEDATQAIHAELATRAVAHIDSLRTDVATSIFMPQQYEASQDTAPESVVDAQPDEGSTNEDI